MFSQNLDTINYYTSAQTNKQVQKPRSVYMTGAQRKEIITEVGAGAAHLYAYYLEKAGIKNFPYCDKVAARALGFTPHTVKRYRLALTQHDWFYQSTFSNNCGRKVRITYLGKATVTAFKNENDPIWKDHEKLNKIMDIMEIHTIEELRADLSRAKEIWDSLDN